MAAVCRQFDHMDHTLYDIGKLNNKNIKSMLKEKIKQMCEHR